MLLLFIGLTSTLVAVEHTKEYKFTQNGQELRFKIQREQIVTTLTLPNGKSYPLVEGVYAIFVNDLLQGPDGSIFLVTSGNFGCHVAIYNGLDFYKILQGPFMVHNKYPYLQQDEIIYDLLPSNGEDEFAGLLRFKNNKWQLFPYTWEKKKNAAEIVEFLNHEIQIQHYYWTGEEKVENTFFHLLEGFYFLK